MSNKLKSTLLLSVLLSSTASTFLSAPLVDQAEEVTALASTKPVEGHLTNSGKSIHTAEQVGDEAEKFIASKHKLATPEWEDARDVQLKAQGKKVGKMTEAQKNATPIRWIVQLTEAPADDQLKIDLDGDSALKTVKEKTKNVINRQKKIREKFEKKTKTKAL
ncbi:MAG: hypothetical protein LBD38_05410, partial [Streptococcaceae bacterium]|nr:hypothetical protein [Streptococcaceae bacterium]